MSWFTDRHPPVRTPAVRRWLPPLMPSAGECDDVVPAAPPLTFDEDDLARMAASLVERSAQEAQATTAASPAARQVEALERAAATFATAAGHNTAAERAAVARLVSLAGAIARALGPTARDPVGLAALAGEMLVGLDAPRARLVTAPGLVDLLRPVLSDIAARAAFGGVLELEADPRLADGAMQLQWPGGWIERDPHLAGQQVGLLLAPSEEHCVEQGTFDDQR